MTRLWNLFLRFCRPQLREVKAHFLWREIEVLGDRFTINSSIVDLDQG